MLCSGCKSDKDLLKCNNCAYSYCYLCLNVTPDSSKQISADLLASLSCPSCQNITRRKRNDDTPVKCHYRFPDDSMNASFSQASTVECHSKIAESAASGASVNDGPVTMESISRLFDMKLSPDSAFMINLRSALKNDVEEMVSVEVSRAVEVVKTEFVTTTNLISAEQSNLKLEIAEKDNRIKKLESELSKNHAVICKLHNRVTTLEKVSRELNVEIHEVPEGKNEDLPLLFKKLCECLQVTISDGDIKACRRVAKMNTASKRPRNILVSLSSQRQRDILLSAVTRFNKAQSSNKLCLTHLGFKDATSRVYLSEHLSPETKELHSLARKFCKENNYKFVWVRFGQVSIRKDEKSPAILIKNIEILNKLRSE